MTPEPTALTDAYGMIKCLVRRHPRARIQLVVNMVADTAQAREIHRRMNLVTQRFLDRSIGFGGAIPLDPAVPAAVCHRLPFALYAPGARVTTAIHDVARRLVRGDTGPDPEPTPGGFFQRLAALVNRRGTSRRR